MIYCFEIADGMRGCTFDVDPFDQPGVDAHKKKMLALLKMPGFEGETKAIKAHL
ncbi:hypothetical protein [Mangrovibacterium lignilyticum]|uniref:hypothetical protein n=1 Tax=Mangrovibacterium lignilyticum TaxID=2668052 RepID=UPI0013D1A651|nr:hypothetical protein [Mangrovibacterium lignilyticum]